MAVLTGKEQEKLRVIYAALTIEDFGQIPGFELNLLERFDKYVNEYLESLQPPQTIE
jgi:hypothetical protein